MKLQGLEKGTSKGESLSANFYQFIPTNFQEPSPQKIKVGKYPRICRSEIIYNLGISLSKLKLHEILTFY
jgi:hypothetical protein